jgi:hypothetical protein
VTFFNPTLRANEKKVYLACSPMISIEHYRTYNWKKMNSLSLDSSFFFSLCMCYSSVSLFTGSLRAFIHRVCARPSFFFVARWVTSRKKRQRRKKTRRDGLVHMKVYYKKKAKRRRSDRDEKRQSSRWTREKKKKREVRRDWLVHFDNWNEDDKEILSPVRREKKER